MYHIKKRLSKVILIISGIAIVAIGVLLGTKSFIFQEACKVPAGFGQFIYDEREFHPRPSFFIKMNLPTELIRDPRERNSWIGGVWFPFFQFTNQATIRYFNIFLAHDPSDYPTTLGYIHSNIRLAENAFPNPNANMPPNQTNVTKVIGPKELVQKRMGRIQCIKEFWKYVDEVYFIEPTTVQARDYFDLQGVAHSTTSEDDDPIESPFGLYAVKFIDGVPLILHFVWANEDEDIFFRDKPYSVFDVLWSIRFDVIKKDK